MVKRVLYLLSFLLLPAFNTAFGQEMEKSLIWEISGKGIKRSYLYGTMHISDPRVFDFKPGVMEAFKSAKVYAMELDMDKAMNPSILGKLVMDSSKTIQSLLSEEDFQLISNYFSDSLNLNIMLFNRMQPVFLSSMISIKTLGTPPDDAEEKRDALDLYFFKLAKAQKKQIEGLETVEDQLMVLNSISYETQAKALVELIKNMGETEAEMMDMLQTYIDGDLVKLLEKTKEEERSPDFYETFLVKRNEKMLDKIIPLIKKKTVFIAVGAAHLPGEEGLINLLREKGYSVTAK